MPIVGGKFWNFMAELILLTTPIGNVGDLSENAKILLQESFFFLAEDTRRLMNLLVLLHIDTSNKNIRSFHDYSRLKLDEAVRWIIEKERVVFLSDAGSPVISDPGFPLVQACYKKGIKIKSCPGVSSVLVSLEQSGLPPVPFHFQGFFPRGPGYIKKTVEKTLFQKGTHVFFESPKRIIKTIDILLSYEDLKKIVLARELTKTYEEMIFITKKDKVFLKDKITQKGEFVVLYFVNCEKNMFPTILRLAQDYLKKPTPKKLTRILAKILNKNTKDIYHRPH